MASTQQFRIDGLLLAIPVVGMIGGYLLPTAQKRALGFAYLEPTLMTAYTSHIVHIEWTHLLGNLLSYVLLASTGWLLYRLAGYRDIWLPWMGTYLLAFPPVLAGLNLAVERNAITIGFSGLNTALLGALPVGIGLLLARNTVFEIQQSPVLFVPPLWVLVLSGVPHTPLAGIGSGLVGLLTLVYLSALRGQFQSIWRTTKDLLYQPVVAEILVTGVVLLFAYPVVVFPIEPTTGNGITNYYIHLLGYTMGVIVTFIQALLFTE